MYKSLRYGRISVSCDHGWLKWLLDVIVDVDVITVEVLLRYSLHKNGTVTGSDRDEQSLLSSLSSKRH